MYQSFDLFTPDLCNWQAEMVNNALQVQRTFLKMTATHQEPAQVQLRNIPTSFVYLSSMPVQRSQHGTDSIRLENVL